MRSVIITLFTVLLVVQYAYNQHNPFIDRTKVYLQELAQDPYFSMSITIAQGSVVVLEEAYGYASREHQVLNTTSTVFNIASIGKPFTAVAILQLREQGRVDLHQPLGTYLPQFPNAYIHDSITIHQLLTHTSGLPLWPSETFNQNSKFEYQTLDDYLVLYDTIKVDRSKVGQRSYSNAGYIALGFIIEAISGMSYTDYLKQHLFDPLGMRKTNVWQLTEIIPHAAVGYIRPASKTDWWKPNYHLNIGGSPAGGAYASSGDLIRFFNGLKTNKILRQASKELMFSPQVKSSYGDYGYGIGIDNLNGQTIYGHLGGYYGIRGELMWYSESDYTISILANSDQTDYTDVSYFIKVQLTGTEAEREAYEQTLNTLRQIDFPRIKTLSELDHFAQKGSFDESLIQIKGYYYLNKQDYSQAKKIFYLNTICFPESSTAQNDFNRVKELSGLSIE